MFQVASAVSPIFALIAVFIALLTASVLVRVFGKEETSGRFSSLDGLRGFLVLGVFLHHSVIWYFYLQTGKWDVPPSALYTHFGQSGVALFFMITGFLFFSKLLNAREKRISWRQIYLSRLLRLAPLHLFATLLIFGIVVSITGFHLHESPLKVAINALRWITFGIYGRPNLNGVENTATIDAGVLWSLSYEWLFYAALPLGALVVGLSPSRRIVIGSVLVCLLIAGGMRGLGMIHLLTFAGGIAAAYCARNERICRAASGAAGNIVALACVGAVVTLFPSAYTPPAIMLLTIAFIVISCGGTLFGILTLKPAQLIGDMGYSVYLLHGILLFVTFSAVKSLGITLSVELHWQIVLSLVAPMILLCYTTFRFIELPAMNAVPRFLAWIARKERIAEPVAVLQGQA